MNRRLFLKGTAVAAATATVLKNAYAAATTVSPAPVNPLIMTQPTLAKPLAHFVETTSACSTSGEMCVQHCQDQLVKGVTDFQTCLAAASQMSVICESTSKLAALKSVRMKESLELCAAACKACKEACEEHKAHWKHGMHLECKACAEHCEKVLAEIETLKSLLQV